MKLHFFEYKSLEKELAELPHFHRIAFAASCCERMLPTYDFFCEMYNFGDPKVPRSALNEVWQILEGKAIDPLRIKELLDDSYQDDIFPDDLSFGGIDCYQAQETILAILNTLDLIIENDLHSIITLVEHLRNIIESHLDEDNYDSEYIESQPLAIQELAKETEDLQRLKQTPILDRDFLDWLRTSFHKEGKSLINLA